MRPNRSSVLFLSALPLAFVFCGSPAPVSPDRYAPVDALFEKVDRNVAAARGLQKVVEIDHSRLAATAGAVMPPARVLIFSNPEMESRLLERNLMAGVDLPLRVLAFEDTHSKQARLIYNRFSYLASRYRLPSELASAYEDSLSGAVAGIPPDQIAEFSDNDMAENGIVTLDSDFGFDETLDRVQKAIASQGDTMTFGIVDFQENAKAFGIALRPIRLVLFGAPAPGAKAMRDAPTLGLDAFCQKLLVWQDSDRTVYVSFNDLLALAERHGVGSSVPLRVINRRLNATFRAAIRAPKED